MLITSVPTYVLSMPTFLMSSLVTVFRPEKEKLQSILHGIERSGHMILSQSDGLKLYTVEPLLKDTLEIRTPL